MADRFSRVRGLSFRRPIDYDSKFTADPNLGKS
jgi:hypothetical protein